MPPRITVIMATYNWSSVLPYSIGSALDQTFTDFELLVIGDGCTDESADVVRAIDDPRVHWHNLAENAGHQAAPNNDGLRRARGTLVAYLGHDDIWLPHHLETLVAACRDGARIAHASTLRSPAPGSGEPYPGDGWVWRPGLWVPPTTVMHERD